MAKAKTKTAEVVEEVTAAAEEQVQDITNPTPSKDKKPSATSYLVEALPLKRERLAPQMRALVDSIEKMQVQGEDGKSRVTRSALFEAWADATKSENGEKVFASYMHQLLSLGFLDKVGGDGEKKAKKTTSPEEKKQKLLDMLAKLPEADRRELLAKLAG